MITAKKPVTSPRSLRGLYAAKRRLERRDAARRYRHTQPERFLTAQTGGVTVDDFGLRPGGCREPSAPSSPGPDVGADHGSDLRDHDGSLPKISRPRGRPARPPRSGPGCAAPSRRRRRPRDVLRSRSTIRSNARREVRTRSIGVISDSTVRIGLIFSAEPSQAWAPAIRPPRRRYSSVSIANHIFSCARASRARCGHGGAVGSVARRRGGREHHQTLAAAGGPGVDHVHALGPVAELLAGLLGRADGARHPAGEVDRDDVVAGVEQRLVDREEVADRRLRGGRQVGVRSRSRA